MEYLTADVKAIAEVLRWNRDRGYYTTVLVGAGMSLSAGIPLAQGIMKEIEKQFPCAADNCPDKTYPAYMAALSPVERRELIGYFVDRAKINLAHLYLGSLVHAGYVDHILTTNFDPLIVRSLVLFNIYPAVYDFAASQTFIPGEAAQRSVFHLHGQRDGFILLNTKSEVEGLYNNLGDLFLDTNRKRSWIVVGYSGENDPVFKRLAEIEVFQHRMYWVGYMEGEPPPHVLENILSPAAKRYAFYVKTYDADSFFVALARELKLEHPPIVRTPFTYLGEVINNIVDKCYVDGREADIMAEARRWVAEASRGFEDRQGFRAQEGMNTEQIERDDLVRRARDIWLGGKYDEVTGLAEDPRSKDIPEVGESLSFALNNRGVELATLARAKSGEGGARLYEEAIDNFRRAAELNPTLHEALTNWGAALGDLAKAKASEEGDRLYGEAIQKCEAALKVRPGSHEALINWGNALRGLAGTKAGEEAEKLYREATQKYEAALKVRPGSHEALINWGATLGDLAKTKAGKEADRLYGEAIQKYEAALKFKPDSYEALTNWASALIYLGRTKGGSERESLLNEALQKCRAAAAIRSGEGAYNMACIYALKGDAGEALSHLGAALMAKPTPSRGHILEDTDLDSIKSTSEFRELMDKYRPQ